MTNISVIICAYNPNQDIFVKVIESLKNQSLSTKFWELIIIDNNSVLPIANWLDLSWHPNAKIVVEQQQGLIYARNRGTLESKFEYLASVDDDTPLFSDYLENVQMIYTEFPDLGIIGGRSFPIFEIQPPSYVNKFKTFLAIRDLGEQRIFQKLADEKVINYPSCSPILIAPRRTCMIEYLDYFNKNEISKDLGRKGNSLASGEDNDINLFIYKRGYTLAYFPELKFHHIIQKSRLSLNYFKKMAYESNRSWVKVSELHGINPWKKINKYSIPIRKIKAFFKHKPWQSDEQAINYNASIGIFKGLSELE